MSLDKRRGRQLEGGDRSLGGAFYPLYQWLFSEDSDFVNDVEEKLAQSRMADNVEMFLSRALAVGLIAGMGLWLLGVFVGWLFVQIFVGDVLVGIQLGPLEPLRVLRTPLILLTSGLIFGSIGFGIGFGSVVSIPYFRAGGREREINTLMPDGIAFMYALSVGGMNQLEILKAMAKADDTYGELSREFQSIVLETEYFDTDYRTAVQNQALTTPSDELAQFLTDMLSILDSGGDMTDFLEDQKDKHLRTAKQEQRKLLDTLELFGEMYMTLSLFPLLLIIILVIMSMMGSGDQTTLLYGTVYGLIPLIGAGFLVMVSTVTHDEVGDGYLRPDAGEDFTVDEGIGVFNPGLVEEYTGDRDLFEKIKRQEGTHELMEIVKAPHLFFRDHPTLVLVLTLPLTLLVLIGALATGNMPLSVDAMKSDPIVGTLVWVYVPIYLNLLPLAVFYEWNVRSRKAILNDLSENLRKLASANDTGMTLLDSIKVVSETSSGKLSAEFESMHSKVNFGTSLKDAMREFNNKYHVPRLARTVKLISEAQEASSQIQDVLSTAATASENQDEIERERKARTLMQTVIIIMTYLTLLAVMALLKVQFLETMGGLAAAGEEAGEEAAQQTTEFAGGLDTEFLSMLFFHAVTLQALISSFIAGYIRNVEVLSGAKYAVILSTIALITWIIVEQITGGGGEETAQMLLLVAGPAGWSISDSLDPRTGYSDDRTGGTNRR
ncbi:flagellar protein FlaJ [Halovenus aranensis]|uniref:Flagellar protein FlaJ n=1 Tax=Halovenus aranensis TaxID=890420 RepID=A0A1G8RYD5_9EURY|nr:type II secretion system F family protein [Halovenus aranensis]SDJ21430.1 flagellar protein FlaJ [Halovenus aranensis]